MPTTLPIRSRDSDFGRKRGLSRSAAALLLWAVMMISVTAASHMSSAADFENCDLVLPMNEVVYAAQAQILITIIAMLIPLLIWAFRDAEQRFAARRTLSRRSDTDRR